jgi:hypothetical protein
LPAAPWSDVEQQAPVDGVHTWNTTVLSKVDTAVDYYRQNGVNVLLDFHQFSTSSLAPTLTTPSSSPSTRRRAAARRWRVGA